MLKIFKRRSIGPAYEKCPAEYLKEWGGRNLFIILGGIIMGILFIVACHVLVIVLNQFDLSDEDKYDNYSMFSLCIKSIGAAITFLLTCFFGRR